MIARKRWPLSFPATVFIFIGGSFSRNFFCKSFRLRMECFLFWRETIWVSLDRRNRISFLVSDFHFCSRFFYSISAYAFQKPSKNHFRLSHKLYFTGKAEINLFCGYWHRPLFCYTKTGSKRTFVLLLPAVRFVPWKQNKSVSCENAAEIISRARLPAGTLT